MMIFIVHLFELIDANRDANRIRLLHRFAVFNHDVILPSTLPPFQIFGVCGETCGQRVRGLQAQVQDGEYCG